MADSTDSPTTDPTQRLLAAAGPMFAERGFDRATVREIANIADVNVAAVSYYFGDKMGLYRAVITAIREKRERAYPTPVVGKATPQEDLEVLIRTLLTRMLAADETGWEAMLMMREMQHPTPAFEGMIRGYFKPLYDALCNTIESLLPRLDSQSNWQINVLVPQLALGVVGQCLHYRIGRPVMAHLIPSELFETHYGLDSLCRQITASTLAACGDKNVVDHHKLLQPSPLNEPQDVSCQQ